MPETDPDVPDEPLAISAPIAWQHAQKTCRKNPVDDSSCLWNHGLWQFLRLMRLSGTAANRSGFYQRTLRAFFEENRTPRILVSGTADYAMLAQIVFAAQQTGATPDVTVVDICETPLYLNRWYAERRGIQIETVCSNMLDFKSSSSFDMVCTDSFLGRFPHALWPRLMTRWHALLRADGGRLLTASQLRPASDPDCRVFDEKQTITFRDKVLDVVRQENMRFGLDTEELAHAVTQYCKNQFSYPLRSESQLRQIIENAGFFIDDLPVIISGSIKYKDIDSPTVSVGGKFLCVIATRR